MIAVIREALASARSQAVASVLTILVVAAMVGTVLLTTGRTVAAEQEVLATIDAAGTRAITVRTDGDAGVRADVLGRIEAIDGIQFAAAFTSAVDATNAAVPDGARVPVRVAYGFHGFGIPAGRAIPDAAYASDEALSALGMPDAAGAVTLTTGEELAVVGRLRTPAFLRGLEPLVLVPREGTEEPVGLIVVIASSPEQVAPVADAVTSVLAADDPTKVSVQTSESLAALRGIVQDQLGSFSRGLVLVVLGISAALVAVILYGLVMLRRRDFGRRRALGATRGLIVALLVTQTVALAALGAAVGAGVALGILLATGDSVPGAAFTLATVTLAIATCAIAALLPAVVASRREPIRELRVP